MVKRGERTAGSILVCTCEKGRDSVLYERMPSLEKGREWVATKRQDSEKPSEFNDYLQFRGDRDSDCWIVELDIANAQRFIA